MGSNKETFKEGLAGFTQTLKDINNGRYEPCI